MTVVKPSANYNPIIIERIHDTALNQQFIEVRMPPAAGGAANDYQQFRLNLMGPYFQGDGEAQSGWALHGVSAVLNGQAGTFLDRRGKIATIFEGVVFTSPDAANWVQAGAWCGHGHGLARRTAATAFCNGGNPEYLSAITVGSVTPAQRFFLYQKFDCFFRNLDNPALPGPKWGEWETWHNFNNDTGRWLLRVEQRFTPTAPVYLRSCYGTMSATEGLNSMTADDALIGRTFFDPSTGAPSPFGLTADFGAVRSVIRDSLPGRPAAQFRATSHGNRPGLQPSRENGFGHLQHHDDGMDKVRLFHTSKVTPVLWTQPIHLLTDYEVGLV